MTARSATRPWIKAIAIAIAFRGAGVLLEHEPDDIDGTGTGVMLVDGWMVRPIG